MFWQSASFETLDVINENDLMLMVFIHPWTVLSLDKTEGFLKH